jgi:hypothetical protein
MIFTEAGNSLAHRHRPTQLTINILIAFHVLWTFNSLSTLQIFSPQFYSSIYFAPGISCQETAIKK